ncbi:MAG: efflux RND transporter periplasmic adaptor subunit [Hyphomicrobiales bacterium]|nr:efflux RND transporter periplasmic adaptor subunit [Hyphomicrobiales bacterium]MBV9429776.1 efflux RND transporter periplasmic adaptor subunit [Bradyrhizobiaceae bacterium]
MPRTSGIRAVPKLVALLALAAVNLPFPAAAQPAPAQEPAPAVTVATAVEKNITPSSTYVGRMQAVDVVNIIARVQGFLQKRSFKEGQMVKRGDLLFTIERDTYQAAVDQAQAAVAKAQATETNASLAEQRSRELVSRNAVAQATLDQDVANLKGAQADVMAAQASLEQAQINLGFTEITAPIDGRIGRALVTVGNFVSPTSGTLATIVSQDPMFVLFPISAQQVTEYKQRIAGTPGTPSNVPVQIKLPNGTTYAHSGSLNFIDIQVNQGTDTVQARAEIPNPDGLLVSGQIVDVTVETGAPQQALAIPQAALQLEQAGPYVLVVGADDKVVQQTVKLGQPVGSDVVVTQGLKAGDRVIVEGIQKVRPGQKVAPSEAAAATP